MLATPLKYTEGVRRKKEEDSSDVKYPPEQERARVDVRITNASSAASWFS